MRLLLIASLITPVEVNAQSTNGAGLNAYQAGRFLGFDATNGTNPLFTKTNNFSRTKINGNLSYAVNGFTDVRNGYMLLSPLQNGGRDFILFPLF